MVGRTPSAHNAAIKTILDANRDRICSLPPVSRRIALERYLSALSLLLTLDAKRRHRKNIWAYCRPGQCCTGPTAGRERGGEFGHSTRIRGRLADGAQGTPRGSAAIWKSLSRGI